MPAITTIACGQSNMALPAGSKLSELLNPYGPFYHTFSGGTALSAWVAGTSPSYTRGTSYTNMTTKALLSKPTRVVLIFMQGESDADSGSTVLGNLWTGKLDAMIQFIKTDFGITDVCTVLGIPHPADNASGAVVGYYANLRTNILAWAAADPGQRKAVETSDIHRPAGDVHMSAWQNAPTPGQLPVGAVTLATRLAAAALPFYY